MGQKNCRKAVPRPITIAAMKWPASAPHQLFCLIREFFTQFVNASRCDAGEKGRKKQGKAPDFEKMDFCSKCVKTSVSHW